MKGKARRTIEERQDKKKEKLLEQLLMMPIVQIACEKIGIGRATYYRWREDDKDFKKKANKALSIGVSLINEMAESKLITKIKGEDLKAIMYWLNNNSVKYRRNYFNYRWELKKMRQELENKNIEKEEILEDFRRLLNTITNDLKIKNVKEE